MEKGTYVGTIDSEREFGNANMTKIAIKVGNNTSMGFVFVHGAYLEIADTRMVLTEKYKPLKERDVIRTNERYTPPRTRRDGIR